MVAAASSEKRAGRFFAEMLHRYAAARGFRLAALSADWIWRLDGRDAQIVIFGYDIGLNPSTTERLCRDKAAAAAALKAAGVAAIPHAIAPHPRHQAAPKAAAAQMLNDAYRRHGPDVVVKPNEGTGGRRVRRAQTAEAVDAAVADIFALEQNAALSPFTAAIAEIRLYLLDGDVALALKKAPPQAIGDGQTPLGQLIGEATASDPLDHLDLTRTPRLGETVIWGWKGNLGQGAQAAQITPPPDVAELGRAAAKALDLRFGSIDLLIGKDGPAVLEANGGVMLEHFAAQSADAARQAEALYAAALDRRMGDAARE